MSRPWYDKVVERTHARHGRVVAAADLAPALDVLLIFAVTLFVCSGLLYRPGIRVNLPPADRIDSLRGGILTLTVTENGEAYVQGDDLLPKAGSDLDYCLHDFKSAYPEGIVLINADENTRQKNIIKLLNQIRASGITKIAYGTRNN